MAEKGLGYDVSFPLHKAIVDNNLEDLESLLCNPDVDINLQDERGRTPLFLSLDRRRSSSFITRLTQAGCDVNISNEKNITPLHLAISSSSNKIAHQLIKSGADINAQEEHVHVQDSITIFSYYEEEAINGKTPLRIAVQRGNLEGVCMLLSYGADVHTRCLRDITLLHYAASKTLQDMVKILINYYDESYYFYKTPGVFGKDLEYEGTALLVYSFGCPDPELAKLLWNKINFESILNEHDLNVLLEFCISSNYTCFSSSYWLEYLYLILNILLTRQFVIGEVNGDKYIFNESFFYELFKTFQKYNIQSTTRLDTINFCLSLGASVCVKDLDEAYEYCGFGEELEALIYAYHDCYKSNGVLGTFISFILALEEDFSIKLIWELFESFFSRNPYFSPYLEIDENCFVDCLSYFSLPAEAKENIKTMLNKLLEYEENYAYLTPDEFEIKREKRRPIFEKLDQIPDFPTLLELSRNQARKYVKGTNKIKYPYQFHDAVKKLNVPKPIQDLIRFKTPIY